MSEQPVDPQGDPMSRVERLAAAAVIALPAVPVLVAAVRQIRWGWVPTGDEATIAIQSFDQITSRASLLGEYTTSGDLSAGLTRNPGPMQFTLYSLPSHVGPLWMGVVLAAIVSVACLCGAVALSRRQGGLVLASMVSLGLLLVVRAVNPNYLVTTWNPGVGLAPFILLFFLCWVVGSGGIRWFPLLVLVASFVAQTHLTFLVGAVPIAALATAAGFGPWAWAARRPSTRRFGPEGRSFAGGAAVLTLCWLPAVIQQLISSGPGNLRLLMRAGDASTPRAGYGAALHPVVQALGWPPRFLLPLRRPEVFAERFSEFTLVGRITTLGLLAGLVVVGALAVRRRDRVVAVPVALVLVLVGAGLSIAAATPTDFRVLTQHYTLLWLIPLGMTAWMTLGLGIAAWWRARTPPGTLARLSSRGAAIGTLATVIVGLVVVASSPSFNVMQDSYRQAHHLGDAAAAATEPGRLYAVDSSAFDDYGYREAVAYRVRRAGGSPVLKAPYGPIIGTHYKLTGRRCDAVFKVELASPGLADPTDRGGKVLATTEVRGQAVALVLLPDRGVRSC